MTKQYYQELLKDERWNKKRLEILKRDQYTCRKCNKDNKPLQVHHRCYIDGKKPWDYDNRLLISYCFDCHAKTHRKDIPIKKRARGVSIRTISHSSSPAVWVEGKGLVEIKNRAF